eukprot:CAMPEP_0114510190 /NCGR_PEP_ID=MMETSP0109-20121206/13642_1 /TAXON_ID=29199 /ORGANISM="Chlorarachnion reptans, Strain CCCM449" /LENGTH=54 /DNA_ID=CAMNT_0001689455 /DNA_START=68 /DNA_END=228 /DNA_ORIENTATION=+
MEEEKTDLKEVEQETVTEEESSPGPDVQEEPTLSASSQSQKIKEEKTGLKEEGT